MIDSRRFIMKDKKFKTVDFPLSRIATIDIGAVGFTKHHMRALVEFDVTEARRRLTALKETDSKISFNAWVIKCISEVVCKHKLLHGIRSGKRKIVIYEDVDISIMIEREIEGVKVPLPYVIRKTNLKSLQDIALEIDSGKEQAINGVEDYVLGTKKQGSLMTLYYALPGFLRRASWKLILKNPALVKENMGTVMITSLGMIGDIEGWIIPVSVHPLSFAIGSIIKKPAVVKDSIEIREHLFLTALVDHDVIDGAPAFRALTNLKELIEKGHGLPDPI
jgi:pyruvate/2-oxoglutarate dehydrogenase complex dihydrolipoamide acyltransferase (E2) component